VNTNPNPQSGDDTFDLIDDALTTLATRRRLWLGHDLTAIALVTSLIQQAERFLPQLVHDARANEPERVKLFEAGWLGIH
jgi:hypothetical protein